ncbi:MAG: polysaccharide biosynthesis protein [Clostridia bacterium]|nr:polysaccharide biosynthesis protein [Clostridia bacterium]
MSILSFLNLAEMGIESAVMYFMYKPIQDDDTTAVRRLLGLIHKYYKCVGLFVLVAGLIILPFIPRLIAGEVPAEINVYAVYLMNLIPAVLSYWIWPYKNTLLRAHMRNDLISRTQFGAYTIKYAGQILVLLYFANYYLYLSIEILAKIFERFLALIVANRKYPKLKQILEPTAGMRSAFREKTEALIFHKIGGVVVNSADPVVISAFLGLTILGKYENYSIIMGGVLGFVLLINTSLEAGIGHLVAGNGPEENAKLFERYTFLLYVLATVCCCCFLNLYQPAITLWIDASMLLGEDIVILLCMYFYVVLMMVPGNVFENASGLWSSDKYRPLLEGALNLTLNLILVQLIGLQGVLLSTILSMAFFSVPWLYYNVTNRVLGGGFRAQLQTIVRQAVECAIMCTISRALCLLIPNGVSLIGVIAISCVVSCLVPICIMYVMYRKGENWKWLIGTIYLTFQRVRRQDKA